MKRKRKRPAARRTPTTLNIVKLTTIEMCALITASTSAVQNDLCEEAEMELLQTAINKMLEAGDIDCSFKSGAMTLTINVTECPDCLEGE